MFPSLKIIIIVTSHIQNYIRELFQLEEFHAVSTLAQQIYLFLGIQKLKMYLISLDVIEYKIESTLRFLVVTITVLY